MSKRTVLLFGATLAALFVQAETLTNGTALAYFAPENQLFYRLRYPGGGYREFERDLTNPRIMRGVDGWKAVISEGGVITATGKGPLGPERWVFRGGRLVECRIPGETNSFPHAAVRRAPDDAEPPYFFGSRQEAAWHVRSVEKAAKQASRIFRHKWVRSGRLCWPWANPNEDGLFFASLALLSLLAVLSRRRAFAVAGGALFFAFTVPLVMTASRGAFLALAAGLVPVVAVRFKAVVRSRWTYVIAAVALCFAAVWFATHESRLLKRGFTGNSSWSNELRLNMWKAAPVMMVDAPDGWKTNAGKAYLDWYESLDMFSAPGSLINDHLSKMVKLSWAGRAVYAFGWFTLLAGLLLWGVRTKNGVPAGLFAAYAVATWFNPLMLNRWLLVAPLASLVPVLIDRPWRRWKDWALASGAGALLAAIALGVIWRLGTTTPHLYGVNIRAEGRRVTAGDGRATTWVVDDGLALGGAFACKDLREGIAVWPEPVAVGFVRSVDDLPERGVRRLVLGGEAGDRWLAAVSADPELRRRLPQEVVFLSPPFPPSAIPPALFAHARVRYVTGEFNARYSREFDDPPSFVKTVPAMELYILGWMKEVLAE